MYVLLLLWGRIGKGFVELVGTTLSTGKWCHCQGKSLSRIKYLEIILTNLQRDGLPIFGSKLSQSKTFDHYFGVMRNSDFKEGFKGGIKPQL